MVRGDLRFLGTLEELRGQMAIEATSLEHLYLQITAAPPSSDDAGREMRGTS